MPEHLECVLRVSLCHIDIPKGSEVLLWGRLPQIIILIPSIKTLHSTV